MAAKKKVAAKTTTAKKPMSRRKSAKTLGAQAANPCPHLPPSPGCMPSGNVPNDLPTAIALLQVWSRCWCKWGAEVKRIVDKCCPDGEPGGVPAPPKPPF